MKLSVSILLNLFALCAFAQQDVPASIYDFKVAAQDGSNIDLAQYRGKKILIVNTPAEAYDNPYYAKLDALYKQHKDKLVIIGFLDKDFLIAPGSKKNPPIKKYDYNVSFPLAARVLVRGNDMDPIYKWLTEQKYNKLKDNEVKWDFQKYLINEQGDLITIFDPKIMPNNPQLVAAIEQ